MSGLALADPALRQRHRQRGQTQAARVGLDRGEATFDALDLASHDFDARYSGLLGRNKVHGSAKIVARDLSRFARLAGGALKGEARSPPISTARRAMAR